MFLGIIQGQMQTGYPTKCGPLRKQYYAFNCNTHTGDANMVTLLFIFVPMDVAIAMITWLEGMNVHT